MSDLEHVSSLIEGQGRESKAHWDGMRREVGAQFAALAGRLKAIDEKQAIANGRVLTMETALGRVDERIRQLKESDGVHEQRFAEVDRRLRTHRRSTDKSDTPPGLHRRSDDSNWITQRDVNVVLATLAAVGGVVLFFAVVVPFIKGLGS